MRQARESRDAQHRQRAGAQLVNDFGWGTSRKRGAGRTRKRQHRVVPQHFIHAPGDFFAPRAGARNVLWGDGRCPGKARPDRGPEPGLGARHPLAVAFPRLGALREPEIIHPLRERFVPDGHVLRRADQRGHLVQRRLESRLCRFIGEGERVLRHQQSLRFCGRRVIAEQYAPHALEHARIAGEPATSVEARRKRTDSIQGNAVMRGTYAQDATVAGRQPHRAAGVAAEGEIDDSRRHRRSRAARGSARYSPGSADIYRCAVMGVLSREAPGHLFGVRLAHQARAGIEEALHRGRRAGRRVVRAQPVRAAEAGLLAGDVVDVLGREVEAGERAARRAIALDVRMPAKCAQLVFVDDLVHLPASLSRSLSWMPPKLPLLMMRTWSPRRAAPAISSTSRCRSPKTADFAPKGASTAAASHASPAL